jgi:hypothetical protein
LIVNQRREDSFYPCPFELGKVLEKPYSAAGAEAAVPGQDKNPDRQFEFWV